MSDAPTRRSVNGHTLELWATYWRCLQCDHRFENAADAEGFWCGDDCSGKHHGTPEVGTCLWANQICEQPNYHGCKTCLAVEPTRPIPPTKGGDQ